jgi:hypothetical protein
MLFSLDGTQRTPLRDTPAGVQPLPQARLLTQNNFQNRPGLALASGRIRERIGRIGESQGKADGNAGPNHCIRNRSVRQV